MKKMTVVLAAALAACAAAAEPVEKPELMPGESPFAYPLALWDLGVQGQTELMVHVTELGAVDSAYVHGGSGYAEFDSAAVAGARQLRFAPAKQGMRRVPAWTRVVVPFTMDSVAAKAAGPRTPAEPDAGS